MENETVEVTVAETTEPVVETTEQVIETTTPEVSGDNELTLEQLLSELIPETIPSTNVEETVKEEIPDGPVFGDAKKEEVDDTITEQELEDLENEVGAVIEELEAEVATANSNTEKIKTELEDITNKLAEANQINIDVETAWQKVMTHPVIGKLAMQLVQGEEIDVPKILEDKINEDIASMADITAQAPVSIEPKKLSLGQRLGSMRTL